ncbi:MAG: tetratricopeptide repeat protein [Anaerolineaceae bacterium]
MSPSPVKPEKSASDLMKDADALAEKRSLDEAMAAYNAAMKAAPENAAYAMKVGCFLLERGEIEKALKIFQSAAFFEPQNGKIFSLMGLTLINLGRIDEAEVALRRAVELNPNDQNSSILLSGLKEQHESGQTLFKAVETLMMILNFSDQPRQLNEILKRVDSNLVALVKANGFTAREEDQIDLADGLDELALNLENIIARRILSQ